MWREAPKRSDFRWFFQVVFYVCSRFFLGFFLFQGFSTFFKAQTAGESWAASDFLKVQELASKTQEV